MEISAPVLVGEGFVLRVIEPSDADAWKAGEDLEQMRWFEAPGPAPLENIVNAIRAWRAGWAEGGPLRHWGIWIDDRPAGGVELRVRQDGRANVSYVVFPFARRMGLASSAVRLATEWAFEHLGVRAVVAVVDEQNVASLGVAQKAGFRPDGPADSWEYSESGVMLRYTLTGPGVLKCRPATEQRARSDAMKERGLRSP
jgi:RimJ/RimL family protein N-acetyltransferase